MKIIHLIVFVSIKLSLDRESPVLGEYNKCNSAENAVWYWNIPVEEKFLEMI